MPSELLLSVLSRLNMAESKDAIDAAIQSAEYLFASLLDRASSTGSLTLGPGESLLTTSVAAQPVPGADSTDSSVTVSDKINKNKFSSFIIYLICHCNFICFSLSLSLSLSLSPSPSFNRLLHLST